MKVDSRASRPIVNLESLTWPQDLPLSAHTPGNVSTLPLPGLAWRIERLLSPQEVVHLVNFGRSRCTTEVGLSGIHPDYQPGDAIGSRRASAFSEQLAKVLWNRLHSVPFPSVFSAKSHTDWDGHATWGADGVNPLFRFIYYRPGQGQLVAHYDAPYVATAARRTLFTLLLYLTENKAEGLTRFIGDPQANLAVERRDFADWDRCAEANEVSLSVCPRAGDALVFEHRLLHDSSPVQFVDKLVIRSDIFFSKACP